MIVNLYLSNIILLLCNIIMNRGYEHNYYPQYNRTNNTRYNSTRKRSKTSYVYVFIFIAFIGAAYFAIQKNIIKIPGMSPTLTTVPESRKLKSNSDTSGEEKTQEKKITSDEIPCHYDCSSIPGSSCVNGKCTDPYLQLY